MWFEKEVSPTLKGAEVMSPPSPISRFNRFFPPSHDPQNTEHSAPAAQSHAVGQRFIQTDDIRSGQEHHPEQSPANQPSHPPTRPSAKPLFTWQTLLSHEVPVNRRGQNLKVAPQGKRANSHRPTNLQRTMPNSASPSLRVKPDLELPKRSNPVTSQENEAQIWHLIATQPDNSRGQDLLNDLNQALSQKGEAAIQRLIAADPDNQSESTQIEQFSNPSTAAQWQADVRREPDHQVSRMNHGMLADIGQHQLPLPTQTVLNKVAAALMSEPLQLSLNQLLSIAQCGGHRLATVHALRHQLSAAPYHMTRDEIVKIASSESGSKKLKLISGMLPKLISRECGLTRDQVIGIAMQRAGQNKLMAVAALLPTLTSPAYGLGTAQVLALVSKNCGANKLYALRDFWPQVLTQNPHLSREQVLAIAIRPSGPQVLKTLAHTS